MLGCGWAERARASPPNSTVSLTKDIELALTCFEFGFELASNRRALTRLALDQRELVVLVERRRRRQRPFQGGGAHAPGIVGRLLLAHEGLDHAVEEHQRAEGRYIGAERGDEVPAGIGVRIVSDAPRHAGEAEEVLREERHVDANEGQPEVQLADG